MAARGGPGEAHHLFPKQFRERFRAIGIDDIDRYILRVPKEKHRLKPGGLHTGPDNWNKWWRDFWEEADRSEKPPSKDEVMDYLEKMKKRFGLDW